MLKTGTRLKKRRIFSEELKRKLVNDFEEGRMTVLQLSRQYGVSDSTVYNWIYQYSTYNSKNVTVVELKDSHTNRIKELEEKIKELERVVGQKQITIDYLEKMIELAKETYSIDVKKNSSTPPSSGSKKTGVR